MRDFLSKTSSREVLGKFTISLSIGMFAVLAVLGMIIHLEHQRVTLLAANQENSTLGQLPSVIGHELEIFASALLTLTESDSLRAYLESPSEKTRNDLKNRLGAFAEDLEVEQVGYWDRNGGEIVKIDRQDQVPESQDLLKEREYVRDTVSLDKGEVFLGQASVDGSVCVATPIFDGSGQFGGMILITCRAQHLLRRFFQQFPRRDDSRLTVIQKSQAWHLISFLPAPELSYLRVLSQYAQLFWLVPLGFFALAATLFHVSFISSQKEKSETRRLQRQLEHLATIDSLTGSYNRSHFLYLFAQELRRAERYGQSLCLLVFDLDHFKSVNDNYGHQTGDQVLAAFAKVVASALRDSDLFGRLGGEEFGVVLMQTDHSGAILLAERLRAAVEKMSVVWDDRTIQITVTIGGTQWERHDGQIELILNRADKALYEAKAKGRNQVCFSFATDSNETLGVS